MATLLSEPPRADPRLLSPGTLLGGRYRVEGLLARGGFATVYRAMHVGQGRPSAVKVLHGDPADFAATRRFFFEARAMGRLEDPATVRVFDFGQDDTGLVYLAMELLRGKTLRQELHHRQRVGRGFTEPEIVTIGCGVLNSLSEAHRLGLVHRDLKPDNIFLHLSPSNEVTVKVCDFGIAKGSGTTQTGSGQALGTPAYMSPEQADLSTSLDGRSDLYALGVVLYELVEGRVPFLGDSPMQTMIMHREQAAPKVAAPVSAALSGFIAACLTKSPLGRPASAQVARASLLACVPALTELTLTDAPADEGSSATPVAAMTPMRPVSLGATLKITPASPPVRSPSSGGWALGGAVAVAALTAAVLLLREGSAPSASPRPQAAVLTSTRALAPAVTPTEAPSSPPPAPWTLVLETVPKGARLEIDGSPRGTGPLEVIEPTGTEHAVVVSAPGYRSLSRRVRWAEQARVVLSLEPVPMKESPRHYRIDR